MARRTACLCAIVCLIAARSGGAEILLNKAIASDALLSSINKKESFHNHLQRMLQVEEDPLGPEVCSPAALELNGKGCITSDAGSGTSTDVADAKRMQATNIVAPSCEGPDCLVAQMPCETTVPKQDNITVAPQSPEMKTIAFGPMTQEAFERMAQRKRAALRAKLHEAGELTEELDTFLRAEHITDDAGIPLPATRSTSGPTASQTMETSRAKPKADFEMRFEPQSPAPSNPDGTTTAAISASKTSADFEMRFEPQTPSPDPHLISTATIAESPAPAPTIISISLEAPEGSAAGKATPQQTASGPARPPMTGQEAARVAAQEAAREAALARKREMARTEPGRPRPQIRSQPQHQHQPLKTSTSLGKDASSPSGAQRQAQQVVRQTEVERISMAGTSAARTAADRSRSKAATVKKHVAGTRVTPSASAVRWTVLDYLCALTICLAVAASLFVAVAVIEDQLSPRRAWRSHGTPLPLHWLSLSRGLFRRCRRAFLAARKHLVGHSSDLPMSVNEGHGALARAVSSVATFLHVFWSHLTDIRNRYCRTPSGSSGGAADEAAHHTPYTRVSAGPTTSPFAAVQGFQKACVIQTPDMSAATAQAELLRRRH